MKKNNKSQIETETGSYTAEILALMGTLSVAMTVLSELTQRNLEIYWKIYKILGQGFANVVLGQFGDIGTPIGIGSLFGVITCYLLKNDIDREKLSILTFKSFMMIVSITYIAMEISYLQNDNSKCGDPDNFCVGEATDLLAFSIPIIATLTLLSAKKIKNKLQK